MGEKRHGIIIGGSGLVGGAITFHFHNNCQEIDVKAPNSKKLDLRSIKDISNYFTSEKADFIVNTAIASLGHTSEGTYRINYLGTLNLAKTALMLNIPIIHMSSAAVLRPGINVKEHERLELTPDLSDYAKSKLMSELTLEFFHQQYGLDYTIIRLGIVYGKRDYKIKGFHKLLFSLATGTMPVLLTRRKACHSYTSLKKIAPFVQHVASNRNEFGRRSINFVDPKPIELSSLIKTMKGMMGTKRPHNVHLPLPCARACIAIVDHVKGVMAKIGVETTMPAELSFLEQMYCSQTLNTDLLKNSSYVDPFPETTLVSELPGLIEYYMNRWNDMGLLKKHQDRVPDAPMAAADFFQVDPVKLLEKIHSTTRPTLDPGEDLRNLFATESKESVSRRRRDSCTN